MCSFWLLETAGAQLCALAWDQDAGSPAAEQTNVCLVLYWAPGPAATALCTLWVARCHLTTSAGGPQTSLLTSEFSEAAQKHADHPHVTPRLDSGFFPFLS